MFKALGWMIKVSIFAVAILILGNLIHWHGQTVSDQVKTSLSHAQKSGAVTETVQDVKTWANHIMSDQKKAPPRNHARRIAAPIARDPEALNNDKADSIKTTSAERSSGPVASEEIPSSERQKLRELIQELNSTRTRQATN